MFSTCALDHLATEATHLMIKAYEYSMPKKLHQMQHMLSVYVRVCVYMWVCVNLIKA